MSTLMTEEQLARVLKGTRVVVYVSEPFGFEYPRAENGGAPGLRARVAEVVLAEGERPDPRVRLDLEAPFVSEEGVEVRHLVARLRHEGKKGFVEQLASGEHVSADLSYSDQVPEEARLPGTHPKLIGGVDLAQ